MRDRELYEEILGSKSPLRNCEVMISRPLQNKALFRGDLDDTAAWTRHTPDQGRKFVEHLSSRLRVAGFLNPRRAITIFNWKTGFLPVRPQSLDSFPIGIVIRTDSGL